MNEKFIRNNDVITQMDFNNPPQLTDAQKAEIEILKNMRDEDIDFSDIPPLGESFSKNTKPFRDRHMYRPTKQSTTVRLDSDVLEWCKSKGKGYQTRINAILRKAMITEKCSRISSIEVVRHPVIRIVFADNMTGEYDFTNDISNNHPMLNALKDVAIFKRVVLDPSGHIFGWNLEKVDGKIEYTSEFIRNQLERTAAIPKQTTRFAAE